MTIASSMSKREHVLATVLPPEAVTILVAASKRGGVVLDQAIALVKNLWPHHFKETLQ